MVREKRTPRPFGLLTALLVMLIISLVGCEKGSLGLRSGGISGSVLDNRTLVGIANVNVTAVSGEDGAEGGATRFTTTDSNGNYYFNDLRADEWRLAFEKFGYAPLGDAASSAVTVVVVNSNTSSVPPVRMHQIYENQYVTVKGVLKDSINGTQITFGNSQFIFGSQSFSNRLPTELTTGFNIPAMAGETRMSISVTGYLPRTITFGGGSIDPSAGAFGELITDIDLGTVLLKPETYSITGRWLDVPGWVFEDNPLATIFAYAGNRCVASTSASLGDQSFTISEIPKGVSASIEVEIKGYRMNGPIVVNPTGDFQGNIYQTFSLKNNFSPIMRDVRVILMGESLRTNDFVGAYCQETGTRWAQTIITNPPGWTIGTPKVVDLGTNQVPSGYTLNFVGYIVGDGKSNTETIRIDDDGAEAQIVSIRVN